MADNKTEVDKSSESHELNEGASLNEVFDFAEGLTKERNRKYLPSAISRVQHLGRGVGEMANTVLDKKYAVLPVVASKMILRIFGILEVLDAKDLFIEALMHKYPESGCSYCGRKPCQCPDVRPPKVADLKPSEAQRTWSLGGWQEHLAAVYGARNERLFPNVKDRVLKLASEVGEVDEETLHLLEEGASVERVRQHEEKLILELTDCFAWLMAICYHDDVNADLETVFRMRYGNGCPNCGQYPCVCESFTYIDERKDPRNKS